MNDMAWILISGLALLVFDALTRPESPSVPKVLDLTALLGKRKR